MVSAKTANVKQTLGRIMAIVFLMTALVVVGTAAGVSAKSPAKGSGRQSSNRSEAPLSKSRARL